MLFFLYIIQSVVFDLPDTLVSTVEEQWENGYMKLSMCSELPELLDRPSDFYQRMRNNDRGMRGLTALSCDPT